MDRSRSAFLSMTPTSSAKRLSILAVLLMGTNLTRSARGRRCPRHLRRPWPTMDGLDAARASGGDAGINLPDQIRYPDRADRHYVHAIRTHPSPEGGQSEMTTSM